MLGRLWKPLIAALASVSVHANLASAAEIRLQPVRLVLSPSAPIGALTIHNDDDSPTLLQVQVRAWAQRNGRDVFKETREVLANPAIFRLDANGNQIVRFGLEARPSDVERSYRVFIQEVPQDQSIRSGEVLTLLRISVPIFVPPANSVLRLHWQARAAHDGKIALELRNEGTVHVQVTSVALSRSNGQALAREKLSVYALPGQWQSWTLTSPASLVPGEKVHLSAQTDQGNVAADIAVEP